MFALILDKCSLNVDNFDKSLFFSISFSLEGSPVKLSLQIFTLKSSLLNLCIVKAGERVVPQKAIAVDCPPCLVLFKMVDKISMSRRALPEVMSQRYIPHNVTLEKRQKWTAFYDRCQPSAGPR